MPTVIDAFVVELGLDPKLFTKGQKEAVAAFTKTKDQAVATGKVIEDAGKKSADAIGRITKEVLSLFAVFLGARGLKEFIGDLTTAEAALGRFAANVGVSSRTVDAIDKAAERFGGTAGATNASLERISRSLFNLKRNGEMLPKEFGQLQAATGRAFDTSTVEKFTNSVAGALKQVAATDPSAAHQYAQGLGYDDATAAAMMAYGDAFGSYVDKLGKSLAPSERAIKAAQELQDQWVALKQTVTALANEISVPLEAAFGPLLVHLTDWIEKNKDWLATDISDDVNDLAEYIAGIDWVSVKAGLHDFTAGADAAATAVGGWKNAATILFDLWLGSKFLNVLANVRALAAAGGAVAGTGAAAVGTGGAILGAAAGAALLATTQPANADEPQLGPDGKLHRKDGSALQGGPWDGKSGVTVDGQPVSKSNPMPVAPVGGDGSGAGRGVGGSTGSGLSSGSGGGTPSGGGGLTPTGANAGVKGWWTAERQKHAYDVLTAGGLVSDAGAKGLISRWVNVESAGGPGASNNIGGGHYGIAQWSRSRGGSVWGNPDFDAQLGLVRKELSSNESAAGARLRNAKTDAEGAIGASSFERADGYNASSGIDNYTARTLGGMRGLDEIVKGGGNVYKGMGGSPRSNGSTGTTGAAHAALSSVVNTHPVTTSQSSNEMHIGKIEVNAPKATDADGVAAGLSDALQRSSVVSTANYGPR